MPNGQPQGQPDDAVPTGFSNSPPDPNKELADRENQLATSPPGDPDLPQRFLDYINFYKQTQIPPGESPSSEILAREINARVPFLPAELLGMTEKYLND